MTLPYSAFHLASLGLCTLRLLFLLLHVLSILLLETSLSSACKRVALSYTNDVPGAGDLFLSRTDNRFLASTALLDAALDQIVATPVSLTDCS